jgi:hypothetical protein
MNHILMAEEKIKRDDRVRYYTIRLKDAVSKNKIFKLIEKNGITSKSTAERVSKGVFDWKQGEIELFLATYCPTKSDNEVIEEFLGIDASKVSSKVTKEPVSYNKQLKDGEVVNHDGKKYKFVYTGHNDCTNCDCCSMSETENSCVCADVNSEYVQGYFVEVAEDDKCTECDIEAAHIIAELSAKNQELQKELHTSKNVITTLQKGVEELNETITESKIAIAEVAKERDDKAEEARVLNLDLLRKENNMDKLVEDFRELETKYENLLEVLETKKLSIELNPKYDSLYKVLLAAYNQASNGKGKERHANDEPFENQKIITLNKQIGSNHGAIFQACKKAQESARLPHDRAITELLGAINYLAAAVIMLKQEKIK